MRTQTYYDSPTLNELFGTKQVIFSLQFSNNLVSALLTTTANVKKIKTTSNLAGPF